MGDNAGWGFILGGLVTAICTGVGLIIKARSDAKKAQIELEIAKAKAEQDAEAKKRKDTIDEWREFAAKVEAQRERQDAVIRDMKSAIDVLMEENAECREDFAEQRSTNHFLYSLVRQNHAAMTAAGLNPGPVPDPLPVKEKIRPASTPPHEFVVKQAIQAAELVTESSKVIKPPPTPSTAP